MSALPIYTYNASILREKTRPIASIDDETGRLIFNMYETMKVARGVGLAANQVGSGKSIVTIDLSEIEEYRDSKLLVLVNPIINDAWGDIVTYEEGCLSVPQVRVEVDRPEKVHVTFMNQRFEEEELEADGFLARVIQHEVDHLNGIFMTDHLKGLRKRLLIPTLKKIMNGQVETDYDLAPLSEQNVLTTAKVSL